MPNWVFNGLTIEGNPEQVDKLVEQMNRPFVDSIVSNGDLAYQIKERKYINPIFSFRNIIAPTDLVAYHSQPDLDITKPMFTGDDWYNWNNREWGTKWDVAISEGNEGHVDTYMEGPVVNGDNKVVYYNFDTAWAPPVPAIKKLSAQYPSLLMTLSYKEEGGWGGEAEFLRGIQISENMYDNQCEACEFEFEDSDRAEDCEDCYGTVCPRCGFSYELCTAHREAYDSKQVVK